LFFKSITLKGVLITLLLLVSASGQNNRFNEEMESLLQDSFFISCNSGIKVYNLTKKAELFSRDKHKLMNPASNMKVITTIAGLVYLGPEYTFNTGIGYRGKIENGELRGDIIIRGGCDPDFKLDSLFKIVEVIKNAGIKKITGGVLVDVSRKDSLFWGEGWMWDDDGAVTSPFMSALNINGNYVTVTVSPDANGGEPIVTTSPVTKFFNIQNDATTGAGSTNLKVWRDYLGRTNTIFVKGNINRTTQAQVYYFNVWRPELYMAELVKEKLASAGIQTKGANGVIDPGYEYQKIYEFKHAYKNLITPLNKRSDNLYAEMMLLALGGKSREKNISFADGKKYIDSVIAWAGKNPGGFRIADGSGVSRYSTVSTDLLVALISKLYYDGGDLFNIFYNSLPIAGVDGTLANRMKNTVCFNNVRAKTGSLSGVSTLTGYAKGKSGDMLAFSILMQNFTGSAAKARAFQDKICELITLYN
jgi:D-alanyl-D-alanine carboxypeptidase/D-alanyl-D-alanine-endopeptidase (penicillin-binding protein 4)